MEDFDLKYSGNNINDFCLCQILVHFKVKSRWKKLFVFVVTSIIYRRQIVGLAQKCWIIIIFEESQFSKTNFNLHYFD
jgi:hypothetical protein